ncbi:sporulation integral membrane protein YtvI [Bacillus testis]|uniref:sporulation integral membrane protein YtvI n=1 Tax=Bacillus testis TaxID=1622072 RepID=UPI00067EF18D|nr:sporulation integral membrane protein YtvI [Bacillus testis]
MKRIFTKQRIITLAVLALIAILCYYILPVSIPLIAALATSLLLAPLVTLLQIKFSFNQKLSVMLVFLLFISCIGISGFIVTTKVITEAAQIIEKAPQYVQEINREWKIIEQDIIDASENLPKAIKEAVSNQVQTSFDYITNELGSLLTIEKATNFVKAIPSYMVSFVVYLIALFLFLIDLPKLKAGMYSLLKDQTADKVRYMNKRLSNVVFGFLKAQFLVSIIIFIAALIGLIFIKPEIALVMALVIWIIDLIPIIGSIVVLAPWSVFDMITGNTESGTQLAILALILLVIRRTVEPKVMGNHIGLSPLATLIAMYIGLKLFGLLGFIIGPLILIAFTAAKEAGLIQWNVKI